MMSMRSSRTMAKWKMAAMGAMPSARATSSLACCGSTTSRLEMVTLAPAASISATSFAWCPDWTPLQAGSAPQQFLVGSRRHANLAPNADCAASPNQSSCRAGALAQRMRSSATPAQPATFCSGCMQVSSCTAGALMQWAHAGGICAPLLARVLCGYMSVHPLHPLMPEHLQSMHLAWTPDFISPLDRPCSDTSAGGAAGPHLREDALNLEPCNFHRITAQCGWLYRV